MRCRRIAWIVILIVELGYIAWGAGAAIAPDHLLGPGGKAILPAGFEGYSGGSWSALVAASPLIAGYMAVLYRMYGVYCVLFGVLNGAIAVTAFRRGEPWAWCWCGSRSRSRRPPARGRCGRRRRPAEPVREGTPRRAQPRGRPAVVVRPAHRSPDRTRCGLHAEDEDE